MSYHSGQNRRAPGVRFKWDMPWVDPKWIALVEAIRQVRAISGQEGVNRFIDEWRARRYVECSDVDAVKLKGVE